MQENTNNKEEKESYLFGTNKELPFSVPPLYFNSLENRIVSKIERMEELQEFTALASIEKTAGFVLPKNYFSETEFEIDYKAELATFPELNKISKPTLQPLSANYLDTLSKEIKVKIELQDELKEFPTLLSLDKPLRFELNTNYFDTLSDNIKAKIHRADAKSTTVWNQILLVLLKPKFGFALGMIVIVGISALFYFKNNTSLPDGDCKTLACLEKREMLNEHTIREMDDDNLYEMVDVEKLDKQINKSKDVDSIPSKKLINKTE